MNYTDSAFRVLTEDVTELPRRSNTTSKFNGPKTVDIQTRSAPFSPRATRDTMKRVPTSHQIEAYGVKGMKSTPWRRTFKDADALTAWIEKFDCELHGMRDLEV